MGTDRSWRRHRAKAPIELYEQTDEAFIPRGADLGLALGSWRSVVAYHHNQDGVLDFVVTSVTGRPQLYVSDGCVTGAWLTVAAPVGSWIEVDAGGRTWVDEVRTGSSYGGAGSPEVHFGLGAVDVVDAIRVRPPGGVVTALEGSVEPRRRVDYIGL